MDGEQKVSELPTDPQAMAGYIRSQFDHAGLQEAIGIAQGEHALAVQALRQHRQRLAGVSDMDVETWARERRVLLDSMPVYERRVNEAQAAVDGAKRALMAAQRGVIASVKGEVRQLLQAAQALELPRIEGLRQEINDIRGGRYPERLHAVEVDRALRQAEQLLRNNF